MGVERLGGDPSLNVDRTRDGVEPDIAFTGANDSVPWVVWYEQNASGAGLNNNEMVFAAKAVAPSTTAPPTGTVDGGFNWVAVGSGAQGVLDNSAAAAASVAQSVANEDACSLNANPAADAEDPRVAAGTMNPANPTVPWVAWDEGAPGAEQVFVSRLVGTGSAARFVLANDGAPISAGPNGATRPDITFSGNTPYVTWRESVGGVELGFVGHFVNPANPTFVLDESDVPLTPTGPADVREPISSSCTANPFNADGASCQGGAVGTPFLLFTNGTSPLSLFADAYQSTTPATGARDRSDGILGDADRIGRPERRGGRGLVPVRHDHCLRAVDGPAEARARRRGRSVQRGPERPPGGHGHPLPGGRHERLRDAVRRRRDGQDELATASASSNEQDLGRTGEGQGLGRDGRGDVQGSDELSGFARTVRQGDADRQADHQGERRQAGWQAPAQAGEAGWRERHGRGRQDRPDHGQAQRHRPRAAVQAPSPQDQAHGDPAQWRQDGRGRPPHADVQQARQTTSQEVIT